VVFAGCTHQIRVELKRVGTIVRTSRDGCMGVR